MPSNNEKIKYSKDYWDVKKSGNRLLWRISPNEKGEFKTFKVLQDDFNALKSILGMVNRLESKTISNNELFAKLFIMELLGQIREKETTVFNDSVFIQISNQLSKPLELFYQTFYEDLCSNQLNKLTKDDFTDTEGHNILMDYHRFKETFTLELVKSKLNEMMSNTLHRRS
ncbi:hypothetical protein [Polaribacter sp. 11A2H]|uniref:hypothetical protein n=1 Tax=Polaribacter sp. 11A2H TaxID=2687290 RepID=UPI0014083A5F|nr:hypothetical protein [Polaribacter sp. 11A2H]